MFFKSKIETQNLSIIPSEFYTVLSQSTLQLSIPFVEYKHENIYNCCINDNIFASTTVRVGSLPSKITEIEVISENLEKLNITWCSTNVHQDLVTYDLSWTNHLNEEPKKNNCPKLTTPSVNCFSCIWDTDFAEEIYDGDYYVTVQGRSIYGNSSNSFTVCPTDHVKPNNVQNLAVELLNSTTVQAKWKKPSNLYMQLKFSVTVSCVEPTVPTSKLEFVLKDESAVLEDLLPDTKYTVVVRCMPVSGGLWSDEQQIPFQTLAGVPSAAPEFSSGWFYSPWCQDNADSIPCFLDKQCQNVTFFWKSIPKKLRNGKILGYLIQYHSSETNNMNATSGSNTVDLQLALHQDYRIGLSAYTSSGFSTMHYSFFSMKCGIPKPAELFAETVPDNHGVTVQWSSVQDATNYTLLYCPGRQKKCLGEPELKMMAPDQTNVTLFNVTEHIFALAVNSEKGTSGMFWICVFSYDGIVAAPTFVDVEEQTTETTILVKWLPATCDSPDSKIPRGRPINFTVTYKVTGTDAEKSVVVPGNAIQLLIQDLTIGSNYTISVQGSSRLQQGKAKQIFHLLRQRTGDHLKIVLVAVILCIVIIMIIFIILNSYRKLRRYFQLHIKTPSVMDLNSKELAEYQTKDKYSDSVDGYAIASAEPLLIEACGKETRHPEGTNSQFDSSESLHQIDIKLNSTQESSNRNSSYFKAKDSSADNNPPNHQISLEDSEKHSHEEMKLQGSCSVDSSGEMGYASTNIMHHIASHGPPQLTCYDNSSSREVPECSLIRLSNDITSQDVLDQNQNYCLPTKITLGNSLDSSLITTGNCVSSDYSKATVLHAI